MAYNMFDTYSLMSALDMMPPLPSFLRDMFFSNRQFSDTEHVEIHVRREGKKIASFCSPLHEGVLVEEKTWSSKIFKPPYVKEKKITDAANLLHRRFGEGIYGPRNMTPAAYAAEKLGEDLAELDRRLVRLEEVMISEVLRTGKVTVRGVGVDAQIDFGMSADNIFVPGDFAAEWDDVTSDILGDIQTLAQVIQDKNGKVATKMVVGITVEKWLKKNTALLATLDNRRVERGELNPRSLPSGAKYLGDLDEIEVYSYGAQWEDNAGTMARIFPEKGVLLAASDLELVLHYGAIQDLAFAGPVSTDRFPKSWQKEDPSAQFLMLQSAPLPAIHEPDGLVYAQVIT